MSTTHTKLDVLKVGTFEKFQPKSIEKIQDAKLRITRIVSKALADPLMPDELVDLIKEHGIVTGGISASVFHNEFPNDYDIYFKNKEALREFARIMTSRNIVRTIVKDIDPRYHTTTQVSGKLVTTRATTLFNNLQIITMGTSELINDFDFIHCKPSLDLKTNTYYISPREYASIEHKRLVRNTTTSQKIDNDRLKKFKDRGWKE